MNLIPRQGGNTLKGSFFGTAVNDKFQSNNYTPALAAQGLRTPDAIKLNYDVNPSVGGPVLRDRLWFYSSARFLANKNYVAGVVGNLNAGNPDAWTYVPDPSQRGVYSLTQETVNVRLTWQAGARNKLSGFYDNQARCWCKRQGATASPESASTYTFPIENMAAFNWSSPVTNRLLVEASASHRGERFVVQKPAAGDVFQTLIPVTEQSTGLLYRGVGTAVAAQPFIANTTSPSNIQASADVRHRRSRSQARVQRYVRGTLRDLRFAGAGRLHLPLQHGQRRHHPEPHHGICDAVQQRREPVGEPGRVCARQVDPQKADTQRRRPVRCLQQLLSRIIRRAGAARPQPEPDVPRSDFVSWKDLSPRLGAAYDLLGNGKTAVKVTLNKYMVAQGLQGIDGDQADPIGRLVNMVTRSWTDANRSSCRTAI